MRPTIKDVAKEAHVSVATVSRIINNLPGYSEDTRKLVLKAIEQLGYQPNAVARGLINRKTESIGVLVPVVASMLQSMVLRGISQVAHDNNYSVIVCNTEEDGKRTLEYLQVLRERQIDGIISVSLLLNQAIGDALVAADIPVVLVSTKSENYPFPYLKVDDRLAAYHATRYLLDRGHREIGMISGTPTDPIAGLPRMEGYMQALQEHGVAHREQYITYGNFGFHSGLEAAEKLLDQAPDVTAVFAASDEMAIAVLSAAYRRGLRVPADLSVIGYDNTLMAEMATPPLTTVSQPLYEMGLQAGEILFQMIRDKSSHPGKSVEHTIVERNTVKILQ